MHGDEEDGIARLKAHTRSLRDEGIDASLQVIRGVVGSPAAAIAQLVDDVEADLLVLGAGRPHPPRRRRPGATALQLLATAGCAVLWLGERFTALGVRSSGRDMASGDADPTGRP